MKHIHDNIPKHPQLNVRSLIQVRPYSYQVLKAETKRLIPKGAKSIFDHSQEVIKITTLFNLAPTYRTRFWSEYNKHI